MFESLIPSWATHSLTVALAACERAGHVLRRYHSGHDPRAERKTDGTPVSRADRLAEQAIRQTLLDAFPSHGLLGEEFGEIGPKSPRWVIDPLDGTKNFLAGLPFFATLIALEDESETVLSVIHAPLLGPAGDGSLARRGQLGRTWWAVREHGAWGGTGTRLLDSDWARLQASETKTFSDAFVSHGGLVHFQSADAWYPFTELVAACGRTRGFGDWWGHVLVAEGLCDAMIDPRVVLHDVAAPRLLVEEAGGVFLSSRGRDVSPRWPSMVGSSNQHLVDALQDIMGLAPIGRSSTRTSDDEVSGNGAETENGTPGVDSAEIRAARPPEP